LTEYSKIALLAELKGRLMLLPTPGARTVPYKEALNKREEEEKKKKRKIK